jgi:hypothetical protein
LHPAPFGYYAGTFPEEHRDDVGEYNVRDFSEKDVSSITRNAASTKTRLFDLEKRMRIDYTLEVLSLL